jgi:hypothetical protein
VEVPVVAAVVVVLQQHQVVLEQQIKVTQAAMFQVALQTQVAVAGGPVLLEVQYQDQIQEPLAVMVLVQQLMVGLQHAQAAVAVEVTVQAVQLALAAAVVVEQSVQMPVRERQIQAAAVVAV